MYLASKTLVCPVDKVFFFLYILNSLHILFPNNGNSSILSDNDLDGGYQVDVTLMTKVKLGHINFIDMSSR